ncbi:MAG: RsmB/NOP family class I SAM-dependent RNA methyltransferase [Thermofilaceae archaeon]|nr:RsmB/NOP family class I SAM-dependent RNA methyltransferase [Thermofilaceae archaeon]MCX8181296.1 RsmB/NOP family class I SAM-dependent RNA methyltransferase [Thermofilaceae archaeon]MDW8004639.1 RsmB/NOP family class I SAM-dependent RNA methyltransferase [Thermofilaceae archaeon]
MAELFSLNAFRLATLTLELIDRYGFSLEDAFSKALKKLEKRDPNALKLTKLALAKFARAELLLRKNSLDNLPRRRKCAFYVAYAIKTSGVTSEASFMETGLLSGKLRNLLKSVSVEKIEQIIASLPPVERIAYTNSFPPWLVEELCKHLKLPDVEKLVKASSRRVVWLRVNELKASVRQVMKRLERTVNLREDEDFPEMLEIVGGEDIPVEVLKLAEKGFLVVQDKGSAAVVHALGQSRNLLVLDAAAAPGVKTSHVQQLSRNEAEIIAVDVSMKRVNDLKEMLTKMGVRGVHVVQADSSKIKFSQKFDKILLDAPCTNTGAIISDPALRLSLWKKTNVSYFMSKQVNLIRNLLEHLKLGGSIVYSTCSLLSDEGETVIDLTVQTDMLDSESLLGVPGYAGYKCSKKVRRLYPHLHKSTGFFIAKATSKR